MIKLLVIAAALAASHAFADQALATSKNCMACHAVDKKLVGPSYKEVAARYDQKDLAKITAKILKGGSGSFGNIPMPANGQVNEAEAKKLAAWILSLK